MKTWLPLMLALALIGIAVGRHHKLMKLHHRPGVHPHGSKLHNGGHIKVLHKHKPIHHQKHKPIHHKHAELGCEYVAFGERSFVKTDLALNNSVNNPAACVKFLAQNPQYQAVEFHVVNGVGSCRAVKNAQFNNTHQDPASNIYVVKPAESNGKYPQWFENLYNSYTLHHGKHGEHGKHGKHGKHGHKGHRHPKVHHRAPLSPAMQVLVLAHEKSLTIDRAAHQVYAMAKKAGKVHEAFKPWLQQIKKEIAEHHEKLAMMKYAAEALAISIHDKTTIRSAAEHIWKRVQKMDKRVSKVFNVFYEKLLAAIKKLQEGSKARLLRIFKGLQHKKAAAHEAMKHLSAKANKGGKEWLAKISEQVKKEMEELKAEMKKVVAVKPQPVVALAAQQKKPVA